MSETPLSHVPGVDVLEAALRALASRAVAPVLEREAAFLALGEGVFGLHAQMRDLAARAQVLAARRSGVELTEVVGGLEAELERLRQTAQTGDNEGVALLREAAAALEGLRRKTAPLMRLVKTLTMLGIAVKIESARMGEEGRGFAALAGDVESLARRIPEHAASITSETTAMAAELTQQTRLAEIRLAQEHTLVATVLERLAAEIVLLRTLVARIEELGTTIPRSAEAAASHMSALVALVQFHDMARQRLIHVDQALTQACTAAEALEQTAAEDVWGIVAFMVEVARLQARQVDACAKDFAQALAELAQHTQALGQEAFALAQAAAACFGGAQGSVLDAVQREMATLEHHVAQAADQEAALAAELREAQQRLAGLEQWVEGIEDIGAEIEIVALNASIRAARTGSTGRCLGVIASAIQEMSVETRGHTRALGRALEEIVAVAARLRTREHATGMVAGVQRFSELVQRMAAVAAATDAELAAMAALATKVQDLSMAIQILVQEQHAAVAEMEALVSDLEAAVAPWEVHAEALAKAHQPEALAALMHRYTMESERMVHHGAHGDAQDGLGDDDDNIELF